MIKIAVCDDIKEIAEAVREILINHIFYEELKVDVFDTGKDLYEFAMQIKYDILFLDIELTSQGASAKKMENGMLLADAIKDMYPDTLVIFFSSYMHYKNELLKHEPFGFVNKPSFNTKDDKIIKITERAICRLRKRDMSDSCYFAKINRAYYPIKLAEVMYVESVRPKIKITTVREKMEIRDKLDVIEQKFNEISNDFARISKSFLINIHYVNKSSSRYVEMMNGYQIPISRKYIEDFKKKMMKLC